MTIRYIALLICSAFTLVGNAQEKTQVLDSAGAGTKKMVIAGDYKKSNLHYFFFGKHYRNEWLTPVWVKSLKLDTTFGGLVPYEAGGGRQSKSLRLRDKNKREYVLRSLDKSFGRALPPILQGTFIETIIDDQVSIAHPYSAFTIPQMAEAAEIHHTTPLLRYVPRQSALDSFNNDFGERLYLLEQRPDEDWSVAENFGNSENIISTEKLLEKLQESSTNKVDQKLYIRSRLFDMFLGDWGRHEDQWRWASFKRDREVLYQPIPRDRDQTYTKFDGFLVKLMLSAANLDHLQSFDKSVKDIRTYNFPARHLDRRMTNETSKDEWLNIAKELQQVLTDDVIETSVRQMPKEVFSLSGEEIIAKLKARRALLQEWAAEYYGFLARHVDIPGTKQREEFEVTRVDDALTSVKIFPINANGRKALQPHFMRLFRTSETKDIRLYGIGEHDNFKLSGKVNDGITVRIIGGPEQDTLIDQSDVKSDRGKTVVYDDHENVFYSSAETKFRLSDDSMVHRYEYDEFEYHKRGVKISMFYDNPDRLYAAVGYGFKRHKWRRVPYSFEQAFYIRYSLSQNALSLLYDGKFARTIGKWTGRVTVNQDFIRWTNFFGLGNETVNDKTLARRYYQLRTDEFLANAGLTRRIAKHHTVELMGFFSAVEIVDDPDRFVGEHYTPNDLYFFEHHKYIGGRVGYTFQKVDNNIVPEKGIMAYAGAAYTQNVEEWNKRFATYNSIVQLYIPLFSKFSIASRNGITSVDGNPEFYQYASVGGSQSLRGYRRDRFWGHTAFYSSNELRWITDLKSYIVNGKFGLIGFVDNGRVWMPGEKSNKWHMGYGGGFLLAPFNMVTASVAYGVSEEEGRFHLRINRLLQ